MFVSVRVRPFFACEGEMGAFVCKNEANNCQCESVTGVFVCESETVAYMISWGIFGICGIPMMCPQSHNRHLV